MLKQDSVYHCLWKGTISWPHEPIENISITRFVVIAASFFRNQYNCDSKTTQHACEGFCTSCTAIAGTKLRNTLNAMHFLRGPGDDSPGLPTSFINGCTDVCFGCSQDPSLNVHSFHLNVPPNSVQHLMDKHPPSLLITVIIYT